MIWYILLIVAGIIVMPLLCFLIVFAYQRVVLRYKLHFYFAKFNIQVDIVRSSKEVDHAFYGIFKGNPSQYLIEWDVRFRPSTENDHDQGGAIVLNGAVHKFSFGYLKNYASDG